MILDYCKVATATVVNVQTFGEQQIAAVVMKVNMNMKMMLLH